MRLGRILLFTSILIAIRLNAVAQNQVLDLPQFTPPSPNAASLGKYGDIQIGKYTGSTNVSIPIHNLTLGKFSLPIDLNYTTSGLKVEEISSLVGLGWSLNAGGMITRTVHGLPDEGVKGYWYVGGLSDSAIVALPPSNEYSPLWTGGFDLEPDMFYFNFAGKSGKFVLDTTSAHNAHCIPYQNMQIEHDSQLHSFTLTDDEGNIYYFGATETTSSEATSGTTIYTSTWYLTKITTPYGIINLTYNAVPENSVNVQVTQVDYTRLTGVNTYQLPGGGSIITNTTAGKMISQISAGDERVNFYGTQDRKDMFLASMLDSITVTDDNGNVKKRFALKHSYFGDTTSTYDLCRLKLDSVLAESVSDDRPQVWSMNYYSPQNVPSINSKSQDFWGFYNGYINNTLLASADPETYSIPTALTGANRNPNAGAAVTGCLETIKYPTGGSSTFVYEGNDYGYTQNIPNNSRAQLTNNANVGAQYSAQVKLVSTSTIIHITQVGNITLRIFGSLGPPPQPEPLDNGPSVYINKITDGGTTTVFSALSLNQTVPETQSLYISDTGYYQLAASVESILGESVSMTVFYDSLGSIVKNLSVGGVRIKEVINTDSVTGAQYLKSYRYTMPGDSTRSSGNVVSSFKFIDELNGYLVRSTYSQNFLGVTQGSDVGYKAVTEFDTQDGNTAPIGRAEYYYNINPVNQGAQLYNYIDLYPGSIGNIAGVLSPAGLSDKMATEYDCYRGYLTNEIDYNANGNIIHKIVNSYSFSDTLNLTLNYYSLPARRGYEFTVCPSSCTSCFASYEACVGSYTTLWTAEGSVNCPWIYKTSTADTTYDVNGANPVGSVENFYFDNPTHALVTRITRVDSKGDSLLTVNKYAPDQAKISGLSVSASSALTAMTAGNRVATPIEVDHYNNSSLLNTLRTDYNIWSITPLVIEPQHVYYSILSDPLEDRVDYYQYDTSSNVLDVSKTGDAHHAYIWDYQHQHLIAEVLNAQQSDIAYTSFEADGAGNWSITGGSVDITQSITGNNSYQNGTFTKSGLNPATTYLISYWSQNGAYSIPGTISGYPQQGKTISFHTPGWTLYVHKVTGQSSITVTAPGHIDELRLYPTSAQMSTSTYDPVYGLTTKIDAGNRATYYQYDGLARLNRVRDQDYNILKTIEYQYQAPAGCGNGCSSIAMQTFAGTNTLSYPVGVFDVNGNLLGNATNAAGYVSLWNSDTADARVGTLSQGSDSMHFNITVNAGQTLPASVTGLRYYQMDLPWNQFDGIRQVNGAYVDFGDGTGMRLPAQETDTPAIHPPNTVYYLSFDYEFLNEPYYYFVHNYPDTSLKVITCYHNDGTANSEFDNNNAPATSLTKLRNLRGYLPANTIGIGGSSYHQASMTNLQNVLNWSTISSVQHFRLNNGDFGVNAVTPVSYPQDFMANNKGLTYIKITWGGPGSFYYGNGDAGFKLSRLKSNWNTYFTQLQQLWIAERDWNREDLTALTHLNYFVLSPADADGGTEPGGPYTPLDSTEIDNAINQIANGAGQNVHNGTIVIYTGGSGRTAASQGGVNLLISQGWHITIDGVAQVSQ